MLLLLPQTHFGCLAAGTNASMAANISTATNTSDMVAANTTAAPLDVGQLLLQSLGNMTITLTNASLNGTTTRAASVDGSCQRDLDCKSVCQSIVCGPLQSTTDRINCAASSATRAVCNLQCHHTYQRCHCLEGGVLLSNGVCAPQGNVSESNCTEDIQLVLFASLKPSPEFSHEHIANRVASHALVTMLRRCLAGVFSLDIQDIIPRSSPAARLTAGTNMPGGLLFADVRFSFCVTNRSLQDVYSPTELEMKLSAEAKHYAVLDGGSLTVLSFGREASTTIGETTGQGADGGEGAGASQSDFLAENWWLILLIVVASIPLIATVFVLIRCYLHRCQSHTVVPMDGSAEEERKLPGEPPPKDIPPGPHPREPDRVRMEQRFKPEDHDFENCVKVLRGEMLDVLADKGSWLYVRRCLEPDQKGFVPESLVSWMDGAEERRPAAFQKAAAPSPSSEEATGIKGWLDRLKKMLRSTDGDSADDVDDDDKVQPMGPMSPSSNAGERLLEEKPSKGSASEENHFLPGSVEDDEPRRPQLLAPDPPDNLEALGADAGPLEFHEGDRIMLTGLSAVELNGKTGVVQGDAVNGRVPVKLGDSGRSISVKVENLVREFVAGDRIVLTGLSAAELNGKAGVVQGRVANGRISVELDEADRCISVKATNLSREAPSLPNGTDGGEVPESMQQMWEQQWMLWQQEGEKASQQNLQQQWEQQLQQQLQHTQWQQQVQAQQMQQQQQQYAQIVMEQQWRQQQLEFEEQRRSHMTQQRRTEQQQYLQYLRSQQHQLRQRKEQILQENPDEAKKWQASAPKVGIAGSKPAPSLGGPKLDRAPSFSDDAMGVSGSPAGLKRTPSFSDNLDEPAGRLDSDAGSRAPSKTPSFTDQIMEISTASKDAPVRSPSFSDLATTQGDGAAEQEGELQRSPSFSDLL